VATFWFLITGALLIAMALASSVLKRLPLTASMFYLAVGALLGPWGMGLISLDAVRDAAFVERLTEIVVIVSLFTAGLKLRLPISDRRWRPAVLLAVIAMILTVGAVAVVGAGLGLSLGAAVLLGAVLAPTDPVLASDVQVAHEHDAEPVRFNLTAEAGLNDGTAFPFVMLGLGLIGAHELGAWGTRWAAVDLAWAVLSGLGVGAMCGTGIGHLVIYLRRTHREAVGLDEFLTLGLIALSYGAALLVHGYGFLAVFAAGLSVRRIERAHTGEGTPPTDVVAAGNPEQATEPETAAAYMARAVLSFNEQFERLGEVAVVVAVGAMLAFVETPWPGLVLAACLFIVIRPLATLVALAGVPSLRLRERGFIAWFGVRGVGSIYYLTYAFSHDVANSDARALTDATLLVVAASVVLHGVSVTPLMRWYEARGAGRALAS
jgi:NhaP-type Na+/H+ or K+/H+ antiporter